MKTPPPMKERILEALERNAPWPLRYRELRRRLGRRACGDKTFCVHPHGFRWRGLSQEFGDALQELIYAQRIFISRHDSIVLLEPGSSVAAADDARMPVIHAYPPPHERTPDEQSPDHLHRLPGV